MTTLSASDVTADKFGGRARKAKRLANDDRVSLQFDSPGATYFSVKGEHDTYDVTCRKDRDIWTCTCAYYGIKGDICSHILAAVLFQNR